MPSGEDAHNTATQRPSRSGDPIDTRKSYRVMLDDLASGLETTGSFAIKFSLLTKMPISKMKHIVRHLPAPIWSGQGRSRAEQFLALVEEAGGTGSIIEMEDVKPAPGDRSVKPGKEKLACHWCGFPMKARETHCGFCMTPVGSVERREHSPEAAMRKPAVSRKRLICYAVALVAGIMIVELLTR